MSDEPMTDKPDGERRWRSLPALTLVFSCAHFFAISVFFLALIGASSRRFDRGGSPGIWEPAAEATMKVLAFPLIYMRAIVWMPVTAEIAVCVLNSILWGSCAAWIVLALPRARSFGRNISNSAAQLNPPLE